MGSRRAVPVEPAVHGEHAVLVPPSVTEQNSDISHVCRCVAKVGDVAKGQTGACRKACGACLACQPGDLLCERKSLRLQRKIEQEDHGSEDDEHILDT